MKRLLRLLLGDSNDHRAPKPADFTAVAADLHAELEQVTAEREVLAQALREIADERVWQSADALRDVARRALEKVRK